LKRLDAAIHQMDMDAAMDQSLPEPAAVLTAVRQRDQATFTRLVAAFDRDLVRLAYIVTGSRETAEDAAQAAWEQLWRKPPKLRDASKLRSWLMTVCANEARQARRRRHRAAELEFETIPPGAPSVTQSADLADLRTALARLTAADRELLGWRFAVELPSAQIAEHLGLSPEGARTRLHRLLQRLRQELRHD
jgi:RNA polymerase sigma factor (sigma-70 family)